MEINMNLILLPLYTLETQPVPTERGLIGPQSRSERYGEGRYVLLMPWLEPRIA